MAPTSDVIFDRGLDRFGEVLDQVPTDGWDLASPCHGWTVLDVLGHLSTALNMGASLLRGEQPTWPEADRPADLVIGEPVAFYRASAAACRAALEGADLDLVMDTPLGPRTVADRLAFPAVDLFVHAWDIGRGIGVDVAIPDDVIEFAHGYLEPIPTEMMRAAGGAFGPEVAAPADATPTEACVAWTGRDPR